MTSDTKVGLALGILVMGIATAFFFRLPHIPSQSDRVRKIAPSITEIDQELKHQVNRPYLPPPPANDVEGDHEDAHPSAFPELSQILYAGNATAPEPVTISKIEIPESGSHGNQQGNLKSLAAAQPPELISTQHTGQNFDQDSLETRDHTVKTGETLSSIAQHYLGSPVKYREVFEINQDQLDSPDSLKPGMVLKIPTPVKKAVRKNSEQVNTQLFDQPKTFAMKEELPEVEILLDESTKQNSGDNPQIPEVKTKRFQAVKKIPGMSLQQAETQR